MINSLTKIFDTIGFSFRTKNNFFIPVEPIKGYNTLNSSHIGYYIPYLVRSYTSEGSLQYEVGVGYITLDGIDIVIDRYKVVKSSNNDQKVDFKSSTKSEFYIFANESNFNTGFNNVIVKNSSFSADSIQAIYLLDSSSSAIDIVLPSNDKSDNLVLEFKLIAGENPVIIRDSSGLIIYSLSYSNNRYTKLAYNNSWHQLKEDFSIPFSAESLGDTPFSAQADVAGDIYSFQYNSDGSNLAGSTMYWSSGNTNKLLLGSSSESLAHTIIPTSGSGTVVFNNDRTNSDFRIYGSGNQNLWYTYDGRLGLNLPPDTNPLTVFHVVNYACREGFRLENRGCHPATITMYHKSSGLLNNAVVGQINLAGSDSTNSYSNYSQIISRAKDLSSGMQKGKLEIIVQSGLSPATGITTIATDPDVTIIGYSNNNLVVSGNTNSSLGFANTNLNLTASTATLKGSTINLQSQNIVFGSGNTGTVTLPSLVASNIQSSNIKLPSIAPNSILALDSEGNIAAGSDLVKFPSIPAGRILTTDVGGAVTGVFYTDSFFLSDRDITWNKYSTRSVSVCLKQIILDTPCPVEEFSVNDQIAVITDTQILYRTIVSLDISSTSITGMIVNQSLSQTSLSNVNIISISKGAYLKLDMYTEPGTAADSTSITLSLRPNVDTVFNTNQKDINFVVYGLDTVPAISVKANSGRSTVQSGEYFAYATQQGRAPFAIPVNIDGEGADNTNNTVNYKLTATGTFNQMVTSVGTNGLPSYYGTYDQNGNVSEWVEDSEEISTATSQFAAGGSWASQSDNALHSVISYASASGYEDVGFRVCSSYGLIDNSRISSTLNIGFVPVTDINNEEDINPVYTSNGASPSSSGIDNLGVVSRSYRIGTNEITNNQYCLFLNSVAKTDNFGLYDSRMSGAIIGGIGRSGIDGSYSYSIIDPMSSKPVVYVNYLSSIRFSNWLHNGAPTGTGLDSSITEDGSYKLLNLGANAYQVTKNDYKKYWLPSLNEWHKAAYYMPGDLIASTGTSSVLIKTETPYIVGSGTIDGVRYTDYASLNVSGWLYTDKLIVGDGSFVGSSDNSKLSLVNGTVVIESGSHKVTIGDQANLVVAGAGSDWDGTYGNVISNTGIVLSADGNMTFAADGMIKLYSPEYVRISGVYIDDLKYQTLTKVDPTGGTSAVYGGATSGLLFKNSDTEALATSQMVIGDGGKVTMPSELVELPLFINQNRQITTYTGVSYATNGVEILRPLVVDTIRIGEELQYYSGSILTHNGSGPATWQPAEYLKADGILWNRYDKREVLVYNNKLVFKNAPSLQTLANEFSYGDTIAVINQQTRETKYIKAADNSTHIIDGPSPVPVGTGMFSTGAEGTEMFFCPEINWAAGSVAVTGYAYSLTKGGYLSIQIDQENAEDVTSSFACGIDGTGYLKPNTLNTISTRPNQPTAFNLLGEDIDFAVYGAKKTLYHKYDEEALSLGSDGLPAGLIPAIKINSYTENSVSGTIDSGVLYSGFIDNNSVVPTGYYLDEKPKVCINTASPFVIDTIQSGNGNLALYADLTVNKYIYAEGIITDSIKINPTPTNGLGKYVINAPLTINAAGQIVSQSPDSLPTAPGSPINVNGIIGNSSLNVYWIPPQNNGGKPVYNYIVEYATGTSPTPSWTTLDRLSSLDTFIQITGLTNAEQYSYRVSAINSMGTGYPSIISSYLTPLSILGTNINNLNILRRNRSATLSWDDPGVSITGYQIGYSSDRGETWSSVSPNIANNTTTINGIENEDRYLFRIRGANSFGYGSYTIKESIGTDPVPPTEDPSTGSIWDFGIIAFTGVCS